LAFFPLDEELGLNSFGLTPRLQQNLVRLATWMPFAKACSEVAHLTGTQVSAATTRRLTEQVGADFVGAQQQQAQTLLAQPPAAPSGPALQLMSVDGAMVPLLGGEWTEVKTLALGEVKPGVGKDGESQAKTVALSYFSRASQAAEFTQQALVETHRRGVENAAQVCAVTDGAVWQQGFIDYHRADAVRILDFAHASEYMAECGRLHYEEESAAFKQWFEQQCRTLKRGDPLLVLQELERLKKKSARKGDASGQAVIESSLSYFWKRREMIAYAKFQAQGYPIGSGSVESANKVVVESRLKQAGMRWKRENIDPMLGLRNVACNQRWEEAWPEISQYQSQQVKRGRQERREKRLRETADSDGPLSRQASPAKAALKEMQQLLKERKSAGRQGAYRPAADHPWRRMAIGRARYKPVAQRPDAKI
jgi:hypothetical protein